MLKEIKLPLNTSLLELITVSFFIAIGYSIIYKFSFYYELGIEWYVYSLSPNFIVLSSVKILFTLLLGISFGIFMFMGVSDVNKVFLYMFLMFLIMIPILLLSHYFNDYIILNIDSFSLFFIGFLFIGLTKYILLGFKGTTPVPRSFFLIYTVVIVCFIISLPAGLGMSEAKDLKKNINNLDVVILKGNNSIWKLLDLNGDKLLLVVNTSKEVLAFKIVEYKDVDKILSSQK